MCELVSAVSKLLVYFRSIVLSQLFAGETSLNWMVKYVANFLKQVKEKIWFYQQVLPLEISLS